MVAHHALVEVLRVPAVNRLAIFARRNTPAAIEPAVETRHPLQLRLRHPRRARLAEPSVEKPVEPAEALKAARWHHEARPALGEPSRCFARRLSAVSMQSSGLRLHGSAAQLLSDCRATWISYAGEEGGTVCMLEGTSGLPEAMFASFTHLRLDPRCRSPEGTARRWRRHGWSRPCSAGSCIRIGSSGIQ